MHAVGDVDARMRGGATGGHLYPIHVLQAVLLGRLAVHAQIGDGPQLAHVGSLTLRAVMRVVHATARDGQRVLGIVALFALDRGLRRLDVLADGSVGALVVALADARIHVHLLARIAAGKSRLGQLNEHLRVHLELAALGAEASLQAVVGDSLVLVVHPEPARIGAPPGMGAVGLERAAALALDRGLVGFGIAVQRLDVRGAESLGEGLLDALVGLFAEHDARRQREAQVEPGAVDVVQVRRALRGGQEAVVHDRGILVVHAARRLPGSTEHDVLTGLELGIEYLGHLARHLLGRHEARSGLAQVQHGEHAELEVELAGVGGVGGRREQLAFGGDVASVVAGGLDPLRNGEDEIGDLGLE